MSNYNTATFSMMFGLTNREHHDLNHPQRVGIYIKVPTQQEAQISTSEKQLQWYDEELKKRPSWSVVDYYIDENITGIPAKTRKQFLRMIEDAKDGKLDMIVTCEVSRFSRNAKELLECIQKIEAVGVDVYFIRQGILPIGEYGNPTYGNIKKNTKEG